MFCTAMVLATHHLSCQSAPNFKRRGNLEAGNRVSHMNYTIQKKQTRPSPYRPLQGTSLKSSSSPAESGKGHELQDCFGWHWMISRNALEGIALGVSSSNSFSQSELAHIPPFYEGLHHSRTWASGRLWLALDDFLELLGRHCFRVSGTRSSFPIRIGTHSSILWRGAPPKVMSFIQDDQLWRDAWKEKLAETCYVSMYGFRSFGCFH